MINRHLLGELRQPAVGWRFPVAVLCMHRHRRACSEVLRVAGITIAVVKHQVHGAGVAILSNRAHQKVGCRGKGEESSRKIAAMNNFYNRK